MKTNIQTILILAATIVASGCKTPAPQDVVKSSVAFDFVGANGTNTLRIEQPKDTTWDHLEATDASGRKLVIDGYRSSANAAAMAATEASEKSRAESTKAAFEALTKLGELAAKSQGVE